MIKLYIDDIRIPETDDFVVLRSYAEAVGWLRKNGCPEYISFDHDLGSNDGLDGIDIAKWMVNRDLNMDGNFISDNFAFRVHSANPIGASNIEGLLNNYLEHKKND